MLGRGFKRMTHRKPHKYLEPDLQWFWWGFYFLIMFCRVSIQMTRRDLLCHLPARFILCKKAGQKRSIKSILFWRQTETLFKINISKNASFSLNIFAFHWNSDARNSQNFQQFVVRENGYQLLKTKQKPKQHNTKQNKPKQITSEHFKYAELFRKRQCFQWKILIKTTFISLANPSAETLSFWYDTIFIFPIQESVLGNSSQCFAVEQAFLELFKVMSWHRPDSLWVLCE